MNGLAKISVVIPTCNEADRIVVQLCHLARLDPYEIIVSDGGSVDGTADLARSFGVQVVEGRRGRGRQQNRGAHRASGEVILFLHVDCLLPEDGISQIQDAHVRERCEYGAFHQRVDAEGFIFRWIERGNAMRVHAFGLTYGDQGIFLSKGLFERVGGFPEVDLMEDVLLARILRRWAKPRLLPGPLLVDARRWKQYGVLRQTARNWMLLSASWVGVSPKILTRFYPLPDGRVSASGEEHE